MTTNVECLSQLLAASLNSQQNKQAEKAIEEAESRPGFSLALLEIVANESVALTIRLSGALFFKNFIRRNWTDEDGNHKLPQNEIDTIKNEIVGLMIKVPKPVQVQLGEAISVIADSDFWRQWDTLVDDLVSRLTPDNAIVNNGVLQVAHSIFKRWRPLFRSDELYTEINHVLSKFGTPFIVLLDATDHAIALNSDNENSLREYFATLHNILKLLYDLSSQDLPPVFEENLQAIMSFLHKYIVYENSLIRTNDDTQPGLLEYVKAGIFEILTLYVQKYEDVAGPLLSQFVSSTWNLLTNVGEETKFDYLVSKALQFLTAVAQIKHHAESFNNTDVLGQVIEKVVIPNMALRDSDMEIFEDEPIEFIRRDLEGSDSDTRRRAATDLLRQLMLQFEKLLTDIVTNYIQFYLSEYIEDKINNWKAKDTSVYLFSSIAIKGTATSKDGVKTTNTHVDVLDFFQKHVAEDLLAENTYPITKVAAIKYVYTFRSQLSRQHWREVFPLLIKHLSSSNFVVYSYSAIAIERLLTMSEDDHLPMIPRAELISLSSGLLEHLFSLIKKNVTPERTQENEFLMKCVMRVLIVMREDMIAIYEYTLKNLIQITKEIQKNPSNPRFYYFHFEAIGALIRFTAHSKSSELENALYDPFAEILQNNVQEFMPYVFQLFAALLEAHPSAGLSDYYKSIIPPILMAPLWESKGNVPALVRLLSVMMARGSESMVQNGQVEPILGLYRKLISSKANETMGFDLIEAVISSFPRLELEGYYERILRDMFTRLSNSKTENFSLRFIRFYHFIVARSETYCGADFFIAISDQIQHDIFRPLYTGVILPDTQKLTRVFDRKTAVISFTKTLVESEAFVERYRKGWALTCEALLKLLINPPLPPNFDDVIADQDVDDIGFGVGFTQLSTCRRPPKDPFPDVTDVKRWAGQYLKEADVRHSGRISNRVQERLSDNARQALVAVMQP